MCNSPLFTKKQIYKILFPLVFQNILAICISLADTIMVSSVSESALAGVSLIASIDNLLIAVMSAVTAGGVVVMSQSMGVKDRKSSCEIAKQVFWLIAILTTVVSVTILVFRKPLLYSLFGDTEESVMQNALDYFVYIAISFPFYGISVGVDAMFHAQGESMISLKNSLFKNVLNISGNAIFIFVFKMGASGAAIATLISRVVGAVVIVILGHNKNRFIFLEKLLRYRPNKRAIKAILRIGIPNGIERGLFQFGKLVTTSLVSSFSVAGIAANAAAATIANFQYQAGGAVQSTMVTVVGRCVGARDEKQTKSYSRYLLGVGYVIVSSVAIVICLGAPIFLSFFSLSEDAMDIGKKMLIYHSIVSIAIWTVAFCLPSCFRAANDVNFTMVVSIFSMWVFRVALAYVFAKTEVSIFGLFTISGLGLGVFGIWVAMTIDWVFRASLFIWRYLSGRWLKKSKLYDNSNL